jgi:hypothetical protein
MRKLLLKTSADADAIGRQDMADYPGLTIEMNCRIHRPDFLSELAAA